MPGCSRASSRLPFHYELMLSLDIQTKVANYRSYSKSAGWHTHLPQGAASAPRTSKTSPGLLNSTEELLRELLNSGQKIFSLQFRIGLKTPNSRDAKRNLERMSREVLSRIRSLSGAEAIHETVGSWKVFKNDLPFAPIEQIRSKRVKTNNLADFLPLYGRDEATTIRLSFSTTDSAASSHLTHLTRSCQTTTHSSRVLRAPENRSSTISSLSNK